MSQTELPLQLKYREVEVRYRYLGEIKRNILYDCSVNEAIAMYEEDAPEGAKMLDWEARDPKA